MKPLVMILMSSSLFTSLPALAQQVREVAPVRAQPVKAPAIARPIQRPESPKLAPIPATYELSDSMTSDEVFAISTAEYRQLAKLVAEYGSRPEFTALEKAAAAHFAEATRRLGEEVKAALGETPEEAFRRDVEKLGKEVADILSKGTIGPTPPTFEQQIEALGKEVSAILAQGSIGSNAPRYSQTAPSSGAKPATGAGTGKAIGAGMARD